MSENLLHSAAWSCAYAEPDARCDPADVQPASRWFSVEVPGTAAHALQEAGEDLALLRDYDRHEWWFRCTFTGAEGHHRLRLAGLATLADVWLDGTHLLHSENMFVAHELDLPDLGAGEHHLLLRFSPLADQLAVRRPRPRWRSSRLHDQNLRWVRTTLLGRLPGWAHSPAPVGPWRAVSLLPVAPVEVRREQLQATPASDGSGTVRLVARVRGAGSTGATVVVGDERHRVTLVPDDDGHRLDAEVTVPGVRLWWPHSHGDQPLYDVAVEVDGETHRVGRVGFRTLEVDRSDGAFTFVVNGVPVFARGTSWAPVDLVGFHTGDERLRHNVALLREGNHTMVRVPGNGVYEDEAFLDLLDEAGILLWQDCMFAFLDYPADEDLEESVRTELEQVFTALQGRPSLALVCGGADTEEQAAYHGVARDQWASAIAARVVPDVLARLLPGTAYLRATPGDSPLPTATDTGVCHYLSVPAYQRALEDFRTAGVRFAAESFPLPTPPETLPVALHERVRRGLGLTPDPRQAVHRDSEVVAWDMAHTMTPYLEQFFATTELALRQHEPERLPLVQAATSVRLFEVGLAEWRRAGSPCAGALTLYGRDPQWGPGLGLLDVLDRPKATWYAMRRAMAPLAVLLTDEGFSGLGVHLVNDGADEVRGTLRIDLYVDGEVLLESDETPVVVPARGGSSVDTTRFFDGFRDLSWAYRFGPPAADVVLVRLLGDDGDELARAVHLPGGPDRQRVADLGLVAEVRPDGEVRTLHVQTRRFAQWVRVEVPGWVAEDSWFHLEPAGSRALALRPEPGTTSEPKGRVQAFNSDRGSRITRAD